ncbi:MAG: hypothetical protein ABSE06_12465 [Anaerolineaceae bacterium]|jgi:hypothetical protein
MIDHPCQQEERIKNIEVKVDVMADKIDEIRPDLQVIKERLSVTAETVEEHERALRGSNGDVGVVAKVSETTASVNDLIKTLRGEGKDPGLIGAIFRLTEKMTGWEDMWKWFIRLVVGWFVTSLVGGMILVYVMEKIMNGGK